MVCPFFRPKMFSPADCAWYRSRTFGAHVFATVVGLLPNGPQFCQIRYIHPGGSLKWIMRVLNSQGSRLWWLPHPSLQRRRALSPNASCLLASVEDTIVCLEISLQSPPPPARGQTVALYGGRFQGGGVALDFIFGCFKFAYIFECGAAYHPRWYVV